MPTKSLIRYSLLVLAVSTAIFLIAGLFLNSGVFTYTLDDAYIHLALAENIISGNYGVNSGEFAAAGSSIIWAYFLAPFTLLPFAEIIPFVLNFLFACLTVVLTGKILTTIIDTDEADYRKAPLIWVLQTVFIIGMNLVGLIFTGMEHSLQVLATVVLFYGLFESVRTGKTPVIVYLAIFLAPLIRYENIVFSVLSIIFLILKKDRIRPVITAIAMFAVLGGFSFFLKENTGSYLPTSVLSKSGMSDGGLVGTLFGNFKDNLTSGIGAVFAGLNLPFIFLFLNPNRRVDDRLFAGMIFIVSLAHLIGGEFLHWQRYHFYAQALAMLSLTVLFSDKISKASRYFLNAAGYIRFLIASAVITLFLFPGLIFQIFTIPIACNNIYSQQYKMHRFLQEHYPENVAVNDIGYPAWRNNNYILDFAGLAYPKARNYSRNPEAVPMMSDDVEAKNVRLAMLYDNWFPYLPEEWEKIGELTIEGPNVVCGGKTVSFYSTSPEYTLELREKIEEAKELEIKPILY